MPDPLSDQQAADSGRAAGPAASPGSGRMSLGPPSPLALAPVLSHTSSRSPPTQQYQQLVAEPGPTSEHHHGAQHSLSAATQAAFRATPPSQQTPPPISLPQTVFTANAASAPVSAPASSMGAPTPPFGAGATSQPMSTGHTAPIMSAGGSGTGSVGRQTRVQWGHAHVAPDSRPAGSSNQVRSSSPAQLSIVPPQTLSDKGAHNILMKSLAKAAGSGTPTSPRFIIGDPDGHLLENDDEDEDDEGSTAVSRSEVPPLSDVQAASTAAAFNAASATEAGSRAPSSDGDYEERMRDEIPVYIDPQETLGLPEKSEARAAERRARQARELVRAHKTGYFPSLARRRLNASSSSSSGRNSTSGRGSQLPTIAKIADQSKEYEKRQNQSGEGGFLSRIFGSRSAVPYGAEDSIPAVSPPRRGGRALTGATPTGVLSSLMALSTAAAGGGVGMDTPGSMTPLTSASASRRPSYDTPDLDLSDDDESDHDDDQQYMEEKRDRFDKKRTSASRAATPAGVDRLPTVGPMAPAASAANQGHALHHSRTRSSLSNSVPLTPQPPKGRPSSLPPRPTSRNEGRPDFGTQTRITFDNFGQSINRVTKPIIKPVITEVVAPQVKNIGDRLGLETETESTRPAMARSSAGVWGGLILAAGNIAGAAAPSVNINVSADRPGYHIARYAPPKVKERKEKDSPGPSRVASALDLAGLSSSYSRKAARSSTALPDSAPSSAPSSPALQPAGRPSSLTSPSSVNLPGHGGKPRSAPNSPMLAPKRPGSSLSERRQTKGNFFLGNLQAAPSAALHQLHSAPSAAYHKITGRPQSRATTPGEEKGEYFSLVATPDGDKEKKKRQEERERKRRKKAREQARQQEVFITMHVAALLERQEFVLKLARTFLAFGAPSHRLEAQLQVVARVLELDCQALYLPGVIMLSFGDMSTHTSEVKLLKQAAGLDLDKLRRTYEIYWQVAHDRVGVGEASRMLDELLKSRPTYRLWQSLIIGGAASAFIGPSAFYCSFVDCLAAFPLGALLVAVQVRSARSDVYNSLFEIIVGTMNSFIAAALASSGVFCFAAVASASVVLILPGYIVLCGALELANRSIISGSVRLVYSVLYSLFLGFGLASGSEVYRRITNLSIVGSTDYTCSALRGPDAPWWRATISPWFFFLTAPAFLAFIGARNGQKLWRHETVTQVLIGAAGWVCNYFCSKVFINRSDLTSAIGSFVVGILGNIYGKATRTSPFIQMVPGIIFQLPSGLSNGGMLAFASSASEGDVNSYATGFSVAEQLVQVAIGLAVGLFVATSVTNVFGGGRRRGTGALASF